MAFVMAREVKMRRPNSHPRESNKRALLIYVVRYQYYDVMHHKTHRSVQPIESGLPPLILPLLNLSNPLVIDQSISRSQWQILVIRGHRQRRMTRMWTLVDSLR